MNDKFKKERKIVLDAAKGGIVGNVKLSDKQKKYVKNLLLFALMNASTNETVTNKNFIKLVNRLFKQFILKILKQDPDDDDDNWDEALDVELNRIMADQKLLKDMESTLTPEKILMFLKDNTKGVTQKDLIKRLMALREAKANYRETPREREKRERNIKEYELSKVRQRMMESERDRSR